MHLPPVLRTPLIVANAVAAPFIFVSLYRIDRWENIHFILSGIGFAIGLNVGVEIQKKFERQADNTQPAKNKKLVKVSLMTACMGSFVAIANLPCMKRAFEELAIPLFLRGLAIGLMSTHTIICLDEAKKLFR
jgi:hypothetical protein